MTTPVPDEGVSLEGLTDEGFDRVFRVLCHMAHCDGDVDPRERDVLERYRNIFGFSARQAQKIESDSKLPNGIFVGRDPRERAFMFDAMIDLVAADLKVDPAEYRRLKKTASYVGLPVTELDAMVAGRIGQGPLAPPAAQAPSEPDVPPVPQAASTPDLEPAQKASDLLPPSLPADLEALAGDDGPIPPPLPV